MSRETSLWESDRTLTEPLLRAADIPLQGWRGGGPEAAAPLPVGQRCCGRLLQHPQWWVPKSGGIRVLFPLPKWLLVPLSEIEIRWSRADDRYMKVDFCDVVAASIVQITYHSD